MKLLLALCLLVGVVFGSVVNLTAENFDQTISDNKGVIVKFMAPWCGHCKRLAPIYEEASEITDAAVFADVDVTEQRELGSRFNVRGFPTVIYFREGQMYEFKKDRTAEALVDFVEAGFNDAPSGEIPSQPTTIEILKKDFDQLTDRLQGLFKSQLDMVLLLFLFGVTVGVIGTFIFTFFVNRAADEKYYREIQGRFAEEIARLETLRKELPSEAVTEEVEEEK